MSKTVVDFWAAWCQPCRDMDPTIRTLAEEYSERVKIGQLDVDENRFTMRKYDIRTVPT